jgi:predicted Zn-dependent protease
LIVPDRAFLLAVQPFAPHLRQEVSDGRAARSAVMLAIVAIVLTVGAIAAVIYSLPAIESAVARAIPAQFENKLGEIALTALAPKSRRCETPELREALDHIKNRLAAASGLDASAFHLYANDDPMVNAFALPGGNIVVCRGLLAKTDTPEELAGVLAHEMQHVTQQHVMRAMVREIGWAAALRLLVGDSSTLMTAGQVAGLSFQRADEESADREGLRMIEKARINPAGTISVFRKLGEMDSGMPGALQYLSTHPNSKARVEYLQRMAAEIRTQPDPIPLNWSAVRNSCQ